VKVEFRRGRPGRPVVVEKPREEVRMKNEEVRSDEAGWLSSS
jgi:hypothetical protein